MRAADYAGELNRLQNFPVPRAPFFVATPGDGYQYPAQRVSDTAQMFVPDEAASYPFTHSVFARRADLIAFTKALTLAQKRRLAPTQILRTLHQQGRFAGIPLRQLRAQRPPTSVHEFLPLRRAMY